MLSERITVMNIRAPWYTASSNGNNVTISNKGQEGGSNQLFPGIFFKNNFFNWICDEKKIIKV